MRTIYNDIFFSALLSGMLLGLGACEKTEEGPANVIITGAPDVEVKVGQPMPRWQTGTFEIHSISTGRGEANFYIMPDGTSLLIDAAGSLLTEEICTLKGVGQVTPAKPTWDISSAKVIAEYIRYFNPRGENLDYYLNTHFHEDHMGAWPEKYDQYSGFPKFADANFYINGINELGMMLNIEKIIDRNYTLPVNMGLEDRIKDYLRFLRWSIDTKGVKYETARVGTDDQIVMRYNPGAYPDFKIRTLCASGYAWTGNGCETIRTIPYSYTELAGANIDENIFSVTLLMDFGKFTLFTAGDLQYETTSAYPWKNADSSILPVARKVEVMKASHHGSTNANSQELLSILDPDVVWVNPGRQEQPGAPCIRRFLNVNPDVDIFCTNIESHSTAPLADMASNFKCWEGHVVIRVKANGEYYVYVLDDNDMNYVVKSIHGPYRSE